MITLHLNLFQNCEEDNGSNQEIGEDKENNPVVQKRNRRRSRLSLKRTADRLTNEINKKIKTQTGEGDPVFTVSDPDETILYLIFITVKVFTKHKLHKK